MALALSPAHRWATAVRARPAVALQGAVPRPAAGEAPSEASVGPRSAVPPQALEAATPRAQGPAAHVAASGARGSAAAARPAPSQPRPPVAPFAAGWPRGGPPPRARWGCAARPPRRCAGPRGSPPGAATALAPPAPQHPLLPTSARPTRPVPTRPRPPLRPAATGGRAGPRGRRGSAAGRSGRGLPIGGVSRGLGRARPLTAAQNRHLVSGWSSASRALSTQDGVSVGVIGELAPGEEQHGASVGVTAEPGTSRGRRA